MVSMKLIAALLACLSTVPALPASSSDGLATVIPPTSDIPDWCAIYNKACIDKVANILGDSATVEACRCTANPSSGGEVVVECAPFTSSSDTSNYNQSNYEWATAVAEDCGAELVD